MRSKILVSTLGVAVSSTIFMVGCTGYRSEPPQWNQPGQAAREFQPNDKPAGDPQVVAPPRIETPNKKDQPAELPGVAAGRTFTDQDKSFPDNQRTTQSKNATDPAGKRAATKR